MDPYKRLGSDGIKEVKDHPFFKNDKDFSWDTLMEEGAPWVPVGKDIDATYFPKANDKDDDIRHIIDD
jgi:Rho-associated protein kinase 2